MTSPESALFARIGRTVREQTLFQPNDTLIVALSGGADSTALLDLLSRLPGFNLRLVAAHLNHGLRGAESDADEEFCRQLAAQYAIPFETRRVDVKALAVSEGLNLEDAGRRARIVFLNQLREQHGAAVVALAHHADDQAETVLMRLLRGAGMTGLSGMPYRNGRDYVRPLLDVTRAEIELYLGERGMTWREDASNRDTTFLRNRVRHELLPLLERYNPAICQRLTATAAILSDEDALLDTLTEQAVKASCRTDGSAFVCSIAGLKAHPAALQRRIFRHAFKQLTGNLDGFTLGHVESIRQLLDSPRPNSRVSLPQGITVVREYGLLRVSSSPFKGEGIGDMGLITAPGHYQLPNDGSLTITICLPPVDVINLPVNSACFDLDKLPLPWQVRPFRPGDRMVPFGMTGSKKVKDIFIDAKVPLFERTRIPLLFCGGELIWIAGLRSSETGRVNDTSSTVAKVSYIRD